METLDWVRFHVPLDTKQVTSETMFPANLLAQYWKKLNSTKLKTWEYKTKLIYTNKQK